MTAMFRRFPVARVSLCAILAVVAFELALGGVRYNSAVCRLREIHSRIYVGVMRDEYARMVGDSRVAIDALSRTHSPLARVQARRLRRAQKIHEDVVRLWSARSYAFPDYEMYKIVAPYMEEDEDMRVLLSDVDYNKEFDYVATVLWGRAIRFVSH